MSRWEQNLKSGGPWGRMNERMNERKNSDRLAQQKYPVGKYPSGSI